MHQMTGVALDRQLNGPDIRWIVQLIELHSDSKPTDIVPDNSFRKTLVHEYHNLRIIKRNLYREWDDGTSVQLQYVITTQEISRVLELCHSSVTSGHLGLSKTWARVNARFFWPGTRRSVKRFIKQCDICQKIKPGIRLIVPLQPIRSSRPAQLKTMDIIGPFPVTPRNNRFALTVCDHFTKWGSAFPMPDQTAESVSENFLDFICTFGIPECVLTDQGTSFMSELFKRVYDLLDIRPVRTSPFHPETNGITERFNQTLKNMITAYISPDQKDWDTLLKRLTFAYNTAIHAATNFSPFELTFGRQPRVPVDIVFPTRDPLAETVINER
ncbi:DDE-type integrase/transposase/recombinase, partial [Candidatus Saccharibacteria bacterium]|nr:DDE-type integrase/transposase/recombinase [Candidatus Saccharibacteria bacterium]